MEPVIHQMIIQVKGIQSDTMEIAKNFLAVFYMCVENQRHFFTFRLTDSLVF